MSRKSVRTRISVVVAVTFVVSMAVYWLTPQPQFPVRWDANSGEPIPDDFVFLCVERQATEGRAILATRPEWERGVVNVRTSTTGSRDVDIASLRLASSDNPTDERALRECERIWNSQIDPKAQMAISLTKGDTNSVVATISRRGILNEFTHRPGDTPTPLLWRSQTLQTFSASSATRLVWPAIVGACGMGTAVTIWLAGRREHRVRP